MNRKLAVFLTVVLGFGVTSFVFAQEAMKADQAKTQDTVENTQMVDNTAMVNNAEMNAETNAMANQEVAPAMPAAGVGKW